MGKSRQISIAMNIIIKKNMKKKNFFVWKKFFSHPTFRGPYGPQPEDHMVLRGARIDIKSRKWQKIKKFFKSKKKFFENEKKNFFFQKYFLAFKASFPSVNSKSKEIDILHVF